MPNSSAALPPEPEPAAQAPPQTGHLVMDAQTMRNLEILSTADGRRKGSLLHYVDHCKTAFGKRLLREWVASPLLSVRDIEARLAQVDAAMACLAHDGVTSARFKLGKLPDLERLILRLHAMGLSRKVQARGAGAEHPDARAIYYDTDVYNKSKVKKLVETLRGLRDASAALDAIRGAVAGDHATALDRVLNPPPIGAAVDAFYAAYDMKDAEARGAFVPREGFVGRYDAAKARLAQLKRSLDEELEDAKRVLGTPSLKFWSPHQGKDLYQIEVKEAALKRRDVPSDWRMMTKKKGVRRYHTPEIKSLLGELALAELEMESAASEVTAGVFRKFDADVALWTATASAVAHLDCIFSLAIVSDDTSHGPMCRPTFTTAESASMELVGSRHPCVAASLSDPDQFIPNDLKLSGACLLLTGPNMGGKSTLLRQACVAAVLAQIGCYVPAESCALSPVDRIFTRLGATDRIMAGQSTFFVELDETATILRHASSSSLVILDELGRGTSTFDGTAIAYAVVDALTKVGARTLFATHYHSLVQEFRGSSSVVLGRMSCFADAGSEGAGGASGCGPRVTFLYKLIPGSSDKSYGMNVARLARLPASVIACAQERSESFEKALLGGGGETSLQRRAEDILAKRAAGEMPAEEAAAQLKHLWTVARGSASGDAGREDA